jgi:hypothetical protein
MSKTNLISGYKPYKVVIFYKWCCDSNGKQ